MKTSATPSATSRIDLFRIVTATFPLTKVFAVCLAGLLAAGVAGNDCFWRGPSLLAWQVPGNPADSQSVASRTNPWFPANQIQVDSAWRQALSRNYQQIEPPSIPSVMEPESAAPDRSGQGMHYKQPEWKGSTDIRGDIPWPGRPLVRPDAGENQPIRGSVRLSGGSFVPWAPSTEFGPDPVVEANAPFHRHAEFESASSSFPASASFHPESKPALPPLPGEASGEPDLELPSTLQMADMPDAMSSVEAADHQFWSQFPKSPEDHQQGYDSLSATHGSGFWFGGLDIMFLEPIFSSNNVISVSGNGQATSVAADYNFDPVWKGYFGFESNAGPAIKASFMRYDEFSGTASFVADGSAIGQSFVQAGDPANIFTLVAANAGDRIETTQQIKLSSMEVMFYKDQQNPVSRIRGNVGLRFLSLQQFLFLDLVAAAGPVTSLRSVNDFEGMGPKLGIEYFRPIGHTRLEMQSGLMLSLLFGRRDQVVTDVGNLQFSQFGKIDPLAIFEMYLGVQRNFRISRCHTGFFRTTLESQYWVNGDSPGETGTDFGFYGITTGFGVRR